MSKNDLKNVISLAGTGKSYPAVRLVKDMPEVAASVSKLVKSREKYPSITEQSTVEGTIDHSQMGVMSENIISRIRDTQNMFQLFPDLELAAQIYISSILSPKDMIRTELIYKTTLQQFPPDVSLSIISIIEEELDANYGIKNKLSKILREALFESGAYATAVIPESSVDELINAGQYVSTESFSEAFKKVGDKEDLGVINFGYLGDPINKKTSILGMEDLFSNSSISIANESLTIENESDKDKRVPLDGPLADKVKVSDNYLLLKMSKIIKHNQEILSSTIIKSRSRKAMLRKVSLSQEKLEDVKKLSTHELASVLYKGNQSGARPFVIVPTQRQTKRKSVDRPLVLKLPTESVIPIYRTGDSKDHVGYFILIDAEGNPIDKTSHIASSELFNSNINSQQLGMSSLLLNRAKNNLKGIEKGGIPFSQVARIYGDIVESDLLERLKSGIYGKGVKIAKTDDVYRIMLARSLSNQFTRLIFIPRELMTYFSFRYFDNGLGKSLLDDLRVMCSLRAIILFSKVMALTKNAISNTHVSMTLDSEDPDPNKTIEQSIAEIIKLRSQYFPLGINTPTDLVDWVQRAGFEFSFEGHPGLPDLKFETEQKNAQFQMPDNELDDMLRKQTYMGIGLSPEHVDNGFNSEFATTVISNNILFSKRISTEQETFIPQLTEHIRNIIKADNVIIDKIDGIVRKNLEMIKKYLDNDKIDDIENTANKEKEETEDIDAVVKGITDMFIDSIVTDLPKPDVTNNETLSEAFEKYSESLDKALDSWISTELLNNSIAGDIGNMADSLKANYKAYFLRKWMSNNGFMSELADLTNTDIDDKPTVSLFDIVKSHTESIVKSSVNFVHDLKPTVNAANKDLEKMGIDAEATPASSPSDNSDSDFDTGGDLFQDPEPPEESDETKQSEDSKDNSDDKEPPTPKEEVDGLKNSLDESIK